ncbi:antibiotic biosynthesis monooxygenase [Sphingomonas sp. BT552]|uniref:Antibiotic biosynthesis monooxygenase n=1 Tax=Sphingomonas longa TaxID=2778730 RepID=A0ABS2D7H4_9SPHN|nr:antibiotic biosynthesis monooxygenase [Microvirga sp. SRT01]MBM6576876.1 antibiotic biosynthesis monooxygenase [Sphingomonas sp. BT552]
MAEWVGAPPPASYSGVMRGADDHGREGQVAVVFLSRRSSADEAGYADAAAAMDALAAVQPGYRGVDSARGTDGFGITVSWWADEASAVAWRAHPDHTAIRDRGRSLWYDGYEVAVAGVTRSYAWERE